MRSVAFLVSANMLPGHAEMRSDFEEYHLQYGALGPACAAAGLPLETVVWDAAPRPWTDYAAVVIGPTWDYWEKQAAFLETLGAIEAAGAALYNPLGVVRWNLDKAYLRDLADRGLATIPTLWVEAADRGAITGAFDALGADRIVVKPRIGAGAWRLARLGRGEPLPAPDALPPAAALIQPYLDDVAAWGEVSVLLYGGSVSHAVRKIPAAGDFRVQGMFGARLEPHALSPAERETAERAVAAAEAITGHRLLYARVDLVRGPGGAPTIIELELIEPYHYPEFATDSGVRFARALVEACGVMDHEARTAP